MRLFVLNLILQKILYNIIERMKYVTDEITTKIIEYYLIPHTCIDTARYFNLSAYKIRKILEMSNIALHDKELTNKLTAKATMEGCQKKYGVSSPFALPTVKEKAKQTCINKYGEANAAKTKCVKEKTRQTNLQKYGTEYLMQNKDIQEKSKAARIKKYGKYINEEKTKQTNLERYGCEWAISSTQAKTKGAQTNILHWGAPHYSQSTNWKANRDKISTKTQSTCLEKYGASHQMQNPNILAKHKATMLERYGVENFSNTGKFTLIMLGNKQLRVLKLKQTINKRYGTDFFPQTSIYHIKAKKLYKYSTEHFDSLPELAFYLYCIKNNILITRNKTKFEYSFENKIHYYFPDFNINGELYEIKGDQFVKKDGTWQNPFNHELDGLFEAKHQCALKNNVKILYSKDYKKYIDWFYANNFNPVDFSTKINKQIKDNK